MPKRKKLQKSKVKKSKVKRLQKSKVYVPKIKKLKKRKSKTVTGVCPASCASCYPSCVCIPPGGRRMQ